jgi:hypothetical protein
VSGYGRRGLAIAFQCAEDNGLADRPATSLLLFVLMLVLFLAADERFIDLNRAGERAIERLGAGGMAQTMVHEPGGLLRDLDVTGERSAGDAPLCAR